MRNKLSKLSVIFVFLIVLSISAFGQSAAANTVNYFNVKFRAGQNQTIKRGKADYGMSYVYRLKVRKEQQMTVSVESAEKELTFSVAAPNEGTVENGFGVKQWMGKLQETGTYLIILVMNNENRSKVSYNLKIKVE